MEIRQCTVADFSQIEVLIEEFMNEALKDFGAKIERQGIKQTFNEVMDSCLVLEHENKIIGVLAGKVVNEPMSNVKIFQEVVWYVTKAHRKYGLLLLKKMENWCRSKGIMAMIMVRLGNSMPEKLARFYERIGYRHLECHYIKRLINDT